jgi:hypothetical protein
MTRLTAPQRWSSTQVTVDVEGDWGTPALRGLDEALPWLLDLLDRHQAKATFFVVGAVGQQRPAAIRRMVDGGHTIASHSQTHPAFSRLDAGTALQELKQSREVLEQLTGQPCRGFRAPFFDAPQALGQWLQETGYSWSSSKSVFSPVAGYRHLSQSWQPHLWPGTAVQEWPVPGLLHLPIPEGLTWRRLFWPLSELQRRPPPMFYLHLYDLLQAGDNFGYRRWPKWMMTFRGGSWSQAHLQGWLLQWQRTGLGLPRDLDRPASNTK